MKTGWSVAISGRSTKFTEEFIPSIRNHTIADYVLIYESNGEWGREEPKFIHPLRCFWAEFSEISIGLIS